MSYRPKGKYVTIDEDAPEALGICDYSGFVFKKSDLVRQMQWRGNRLSWTGFLVGRPFVDEPNPQLKPPVLAPDPIPVLDPRPYQPTYIWWSNTPLIWNLTKERWTEIGSIFDGVPALPEPIRELELNKYNWMNG